MPEEEEAASSSSCAKTFLGLRKRLATEERPAGLPSAVIAFSVGDEQWLVDLRDGLTPDAAVRRGEPDGTPDVKVTISPPDFQDLLDGKLTAFKAVMSKRLVVAGDMKLVRSLGWLWEQPADAPVPQERGAVRVRVISAKADGDHGLYTLLVEEGASCWLLSRRWRDLKEMTGSLVETFGRGTPFNLPLPSLPRSVRASTSIKLLRQRQQQMEAHLTCILTLLSCSPRTGLGPRPLLSFLGSSPVGTLHGAKPAGTHPAAYTDAALVLGGDELIDWEGGGSGGGGGGGGGGSGSGEASLSSGQSTSSGTSQGTSAAASTGKLRFGGLAARLRERLQQGLHAESRSSAEDPAGAGGSGGLMPLRRQRSGNDGGINGGSSGVNGAPSSGDTMLTSSTAPGGLAAAYPVRPPSPGGAGRVSSFGEGGGGGAGEAELFGVPMSQLKLQLQMDTQAARMDALAASTRAAMLLAFASMLAAAASGFASMAVIGASRMAVATASTEALSTAMEACRRSRPAAPPGPADGTSHVALDEAGQAEAMTSLADLPGEAATAAEAAEAPASDMAGAAAATAAGATAHLFSHAPRSGVSCDDESGPQAASSLDSSAIPAAMAMPPSPLAMAMPPSPLGWLALASAFCAVLLGAAACVSLCGSGRDRRQRHQPSEDADCRDAEGGIRSWWERRLRGARVFALTSRVLLRYGLCLVRCLGKGTAEVDHIWERTHDAAGGLLAPELSALGGLWTKFGQYLGSRSDGGAVPAPLLRHLRLVQHQPPAAPMSEITATLER